ncbi:MAG: hypothetical protein KA371_05005 [Acidobacteria bacterium]|nr:hypothetical protein [Acidobacteriota bacterium]
MRWARGAHLGAIRRGGLQVKSPALGDFVAQVTAEDDPRSIGVVELVVFAVKTCDTASAMPSVPPLLGPDRHPRAVCRLHWRRSPADRAALGAARRARSTLRCRP